MRSLTRAGRDLPFVGDDLTILWQVPDSQVGHDVLIVHLALYVAPPKKGTPNVLHSSEQHDNNALITTATPR